MADTEKELAHGEAAAATARGSPALAPVALDSPGETQGLLSPESVSPQDLPSPESASPQDLPSPETDPETRQPESLASPQYVEFDESAGPQVVVSSGGGAAQDMAARNDTEAGIVGAGEAGEKNTAHGPPGRLTRLWRRARKSPYIVGAIVSFTVGILALIILPIVLHMLSVRGNAKDAPTASASACPTCSTSTSATSPSQSTTADACTDPSAWATDVSYMGVADEGATTWPYKLLAASDAQACCTTCYSNFDEGCQGWAYLPWDETPVPCTIIYGWNATTGTSTTCPNGQATINFSEDTSRANSTGSKGPCGTVSS